MDMICPECGYAYSDQAICKCGKSFASREKRFTSQDFVTIPVSRSQLVVAMEEWHAEVEERGEEREATPEDKADYLWQKLGGVK